jgi:hypothetical protein
VLGEPGDEEYSSVMKKGLRWQFVWGLSLSGQVPQISVWGEGCHNA